jgi:hypothetical protein
MLPVIPPTISCGGGGDDQAKLNAICLEKNKNGGLAEMVHRGSPDLIRRIGYVQLGSGD